MSVIDSLGMLVARKWIAGEDLEVPNKYEVTCKSGFKSPQPQALFPDNRPYIDYLYISAVCIKAVVLLP